MLLHKRRRLRDLKITRIAFVDKGANRRDFAFFKSENGGSNMLDIKKIITQIFADAGIPEGANPEVEKAKAETIASIIEMLTGEPTEDKIKMAIETLQTLMSAYPAPPKSEDKKPEDLDFQKVLGEQRDLAIEKVGKKLSAKTIEKIKNAFDSLGDLLKEVAELKSDDDIKKFEEKHEEFSVEETAEIIKGMLEEVSV